MANAQTQTATGTAVAITSVGKTPVVATDPGTVIEQTSAAAPNTLQGS